MNNVIKMLEASLKDTNVKVDKDEEDTFTFRINSELFNKQVIKPSSDLVRYVHQLCETYYQGNYVKFNNSYTCFWFESFRK
ncbi:hypothetical protein UA32_12050 [Photobacterium angustum]|uniref:Uncharacterized protein n=1 Tax=Photobacterium angustum TaxID=661 RepID=A0ABX5GYK8_PHOAN|nr:hypothetical protein UA32_12050 [Photobacterium angustum]PSX03979.1 hypothetical protein C0W27_21025 [Photobacterium angustum]